MKYSETPSGWINLGPEDSEAVNLFYLLIDSLQSVLPDIDFSPFLSYPSITVSPREEVWLYREWDPSPSCNRFPPRFG